jgi:rubredoxin
VAGAALWVACKRCGVVFDSGLRMTRASFARGTLAANYHTCPRCGTRETYRKADYELREASPGPRRTASPDPP